jgi:hypothetical protein
MPVSESELVQLESQAVLAELLAAWPASTSRKVGRPYVQPESAGSRQTSPREGPREGQSPATEELKPKRPYGQGSCTCGACRRCEDNARWNRIFDEKFADPSYYGRVTVRHNSSLAGL